MWRRAGGADGRRRRRRVTGRAARRAEAEMAITQHRRGAEGRHDAGGRRRRPRGRRGVAGCCSPARAARLGLWIGQDGDRMDRAIEEMGMPFLSHELMGWAAGHELKAKHTPIYNSTLAKTLAEYTSAVYSADLTQLFTWTCERCGDLTEGFEVIELIVDVKNCLQAYVGFASDMNAVVVVFRGTQENSIQNWIEDLFWKQLDLDYPGMPEAKVHSGFYSAYHNTTLRDGVISGIQKTREAYGNVPIIVTGHSMGGAMASFCALDLVVNCKLKDVTLMTFGQPRIGNAVFASHFKRYLLNAIRVTNAHDIVPHLPPYYHYFPQKTYHHFPREVWVHNVGLGSLVYPVEQICDDSGEDPTCSRSVSGNSVHDHIHYLGISMHAESWGSCRIVRADNTLQFKMDAAGNIVLSKQPGLSVDQRHSAQ